MTKMAWALGVGMAVIGLFGCGDDDFFAPATPGPAREYVASASAPRFVVPSAGLPPEVTPMTSNANVDILVDGGRLFMGWRSAPTHFASTATRMYVVSSTDGGETWDFELDVHIGADMREPRFLAFGGKLQFLFFEGGTDSGAFQPQRVWRTVRNGLGEWEPIEVLFDRPKVPWDLKVRNDLAYLTSYDGAAAGQGGDIEVYFSSSGDGDVFLPVGGRDFVYFGGVSETAFEFDRDGSLWIVTRNQEGDQTGFGSHVCWAPAEDLSAWDCPDVTDPERYDSPEMFRHEDDIYLLARRDIGGPYDRADPSLSFDERKAENLVSYSTRPKRTALYKIDKKARAVRHVFDLPSAGDTSFASVQQTGPHTFLVANYTSPLEFPEVSWFEGQTSDRGTQLYLIELEFTERSGAALPTPTATHTRVPTPSPTPRELSDEVIVGPVFAERGAGLTIELPAGVVTEGDLFYGDGGHSSGNHSGTQTWEYLEDGIYRLNGNLRGEGGVIRIAGYVARSSIRAQAGLRRFALVEPSDPVVQSVIRGVIPAFYWAFVPGEVAIATDPTGQGAFTYRDVFVAPLLLDDEVSFETAPVDFIAPLAAPGVVLATELRNVVFRGSFDGPTVLSPIEMDADIVLADVVGALQEIGGFDEPAAFAFLSGLFGFDPNDPPETAPFLGSFVIQ